MKSISKGSPLRTRESATPSPIRTAKTKRRLTINVAKKSSSDQQKKEMTPDGDREATP